MCLYAGDIQTSLVTTWKDQPIKGMNATDGECQNRSVSTAKALSVQKLVCVCVCVCVCARACVFGGGSVSGPRWSGTAQM